MKEYDLNVTASQIIKVRADSQEDAIEEAFHEAFGHGEAHFATTDWEIVEEIE